MKEIAILHVDPAPCWRGGQQQAFYLHQGLCQRGIKSGFICQPHLPMARRLQDSALPYHPLRYRHDLDLWAGFALARYATRQGYKILHLHSGHALNWGHLAKLFAPGLRLVASRRVDFPIQRNPLSRWKYCSSRLNKIVAISENIRQVMLKDGIPAGKIRLIHSGVDLKRFAQSSLDPDYRSIWQIPEGAVIIGTVAAFVAHKDYRNFLHAAALALKTNPHLHFVAVGDGALLGTMKELAQELEIQEHISFTGFQREVGTHLKAFDIFVIASKKEGLGTTVLDAMSLGLSVIGTRAGGIPEMIASGHSGILVEARDSEALAKAMLDLAADKKQRIRLGENAEQAVKRFSKENMVAENLRLYEELLCSES